MLGKYRWGFNVWTVVVDAVSDSRRIGGSESNSFIEVLQELLRQRVLRVRSVQCNTIHARKTFSFLHVRLRFCAICDWHGELGDGFGVKDRAQRGGLLRVIVGCRTTEKSYLIKTFDCSRRIKILTRIYPSRESPTTVTSLPTHPFRRGMNDRRQLTLSTHWN